MEILDEATKGLNWLFFRREEAHCFFKGQKTNKMWSVYSWRLCFMCAHKSTSDILKYVIHAPEFVVLHP